MKVRIGTDRKDNSYSWKRKDTGREQCATETQIHGTKQDKHQANYFTSVSCDIVDRNRKIISELPAIYNLFLSLILHPVLQTDML